MVLIGCGTLILSDDVLDPHWEQLVNAIQLSERITTLELNNVELDQRTLQIIETSLCLKGIARFYLHGNQFRGGEGVRFAINVLKSNRSVDTFRWYDNDFHSTEDACSLVDAVLEQPTIRNLVMTSLLSNEDINAYTPVQRLFGGAGNGILLDVNLSSNGIKTNGDGCISDFLSTNPTLKVLYLIGNHLNDDDALHIAQALQSNSNLRYLNLEKNKLTANGRSAAYCQSIYGLYRSYPSEESMSLIEANLNTVSEANHTCKIDGITPREMFMNSRTKSAKWNRSKKLFYVLRRRHRKGCNITQLESEFSEDCMGIVPHVLACVNTYSADYKLNKCLSVLFELTRNWKTPEMYQFH